MGRLLYLLLLGMIPVCIQPVFAQKSADVESRISYIVTASFRLAKDSKIIIDSLYPIVKAAGVYLVQVKTQTGVQVYKVVVQL